YAAHRVSQLFVSIADRDLAGVAGEVEAVVARFPLTYALDKLPRDKKALADDPTFCQRLAGCLKHPDAKAADDIHRDYGVTVDDLRLPRDVRIQVRGEVQSMRQSFGELAFTLALAVLLVYLVMAAQFASWIDPIIMIVAA